MMLPFMGEEMQCVLCENKQVSDPQRESDWRCVQVDRELYYVCPKHFPPDGASAKRFQRAYVKILETIAKMRGGTI